MVRELRYGTDEKLKQICQPDEGGLPSLALYRVETAKSNFSVLKGNRQDEPQILWENADPHL
jgi:hypothetical protein